MTAVDALQEELDALPRPLLVLSTAVGRGMYSIGEALVERATETDRGRVEHRAIEEFLPPDGVREDVTRYRAISSRCPALLQLVYRFPPIYHRKLLRERHLRTTDISALVRFVEDGGYRAILAVSHRPAFWAGIAKERAGLAIALVGLSGEYGSSLGWRYVPWTAIQRFLSPVPASDLRFSLPADVPLREIALPARRAYTQLAGSHGDAHQVLIVCGFWGQGRIDRVLAELRREHQDLVVHAVCGENETLRAKLEARHDHRTHVHGVVQSLAPLLARCGSVISKPGIATILEVSAAGRALFLLRGMPVAEDNNLRYAMRHLGAQRYSLRAFSEWRQASALTTRGEEPCPEFGR